MKRLCFSQFIDCLILNSKNYSGLLLCLFFVSLSGSTQAQTVSTYTSNGTFTVPAEITAIKVEVWGGGGAGGGAFGILLTNVAGGGGGGGGYNTGIFSVTPSQTYTVTVGSGGTSNSASGTASTVTGVGGTITAGGGAGGESAGALLLFNLGPGGAGGTGLYSGGTGGTAIAASSGAGGGGADDGGAGGNASGTTGGAGGAGSNSGGNGANSVTGNSNGSNGDFPGGGGSGGRVRAVISLSDWLGGHGANGWVRITAYRCYPGYSTTWNGTSWSSGTPNHEKAAVIDGNYNTATNGNIATCSCQINTGKVLTVADSNHLEIYNEIINNGTVEVSNNASLVQWYSTNANTGNIKVIRNAKPMKRYDYTYWSSPVTGQTLHNLSPTTLFDKYFSWNPSGSWTPHNNGAATMKVGKGYIVRAPQSFPINTTDVFVGNFIGAPNNGEISISNFQGSSTTQVWNLIGNPYPSAIDIKLFLTDLDNSEVGGTVYLWTHNTPPTEGAAGVYTYTANDYASYNLSGGVATALAAPSAADPEDNANVLTNGHIASGQAFFIRGVVNGTNTIKFKNSMRISSGNSNFFKPGLITPVENWETTGKHRFWINLRNDQGAFNQTLIGYVEGATDGLDRLYDGELFGGNYVSIYSLLNETKLAIQGKALPFNNGDVVPLGYKVTIAGAFNISLDHFDGLFEGQDVFLRDKVLNLVHNLKDGAYVFASAIGTFEDRFEIVYENVALGVETPQMNPESIVVYKSADTAITVSAGLLTIDKVRVYDIAGRLLYGEGEVNSSEFLIRNLPDTRQVLIVEVVTTEGAKIAKKIIY